MSQKLLQGEAIHLSVLWFRCHPGQGLVTGPLSKPLAPTLTFPVSGSGQQQGHTGRWSQRHLATLGSVTAVHALLLGSADALGEAAAPQTSQQGLGQEGVGTQEETYN